jgi:hypothetical protein
MDRIQNVNFRKAILKVAHDNDKQKLLGYDMVTLYDSISLFDFKNVHVL